MIIGMISVLGKTYHSEKLTKLKENGWWTDKRYYRKLPTVKPVLNGHSKINKTKIVMTNGSLMKVESIVECSP